MFESSCTSRNGKGFPTKAQAQAEHQRLKKQTTASISGSKSVWCAKKYSIFESFTGDCYSGESFTTKAQAQAEQQRLKKKLVGTKNICASTILLQNARIVSKARRTWRSSCCRPAEPTSGTPPFGSVTKTSFRVVVYLRSAALPLFLHC